MDRTRNSKSAADGAAQSERRRIGTVVHDERGNASVTWRDAPVDEERPVLEILSEPRLKLKREETSFDPYAREQVPASPTKAKAPRKDLRKLSEWIKLVREVEERKRRGGDSE